MSRDEYVESIEYIDEAGWKTDELLAHDFALRARLMHADAKRVEAERRYHELLRIVLDAHELARNAEQLLGNVPIA